MKFYFIVFFCFLLTSKPVAQTKDPASFLGYELGSRFTPHHKLIAYFEHVAATNKHVVLKQYGETNELRPLVAAFVSSQSNIDALEDIRTDNLRRVGLLEGTPVRQIPITWFSYNVHGNEAVSSEASMQTLWELVNPENQTTKLWLEKTLVVLDPCLNPDGRDRYTNWYNQKMNRTLQPDPQSIEHQEPWPGGRANHYLFDLNRDWAWQTQKESIARLSLYNSWMPQVHVDFHEQGINEPYYFAPAAEPLHKQLTAFQLAFQDSIGRNNARYFDKNNWLYFTKERFDLLYPSYGDSYPMFNGAIGMTYEQGGSGRAGIGILNALKDTLTLNDRIAHHFTTGMSTIETVAKNAPKLLAEFEQYFATSAGSPHGTYKTFIIKAGKTPERLAKLRELLDMNLIRYGSAGKRTGLTGFDYRDGKEVRFNTLEEDLLVNVSQPKGVLAQTLFEPNPELADSVTYDITSWALPYAYGLEAYAVSKRLDAVTDYAVPPFNPNKTADNPMGYLVSWHATNHVQFLAALLKAKIRVRYARYPFSFGQESYPAGSLIILRTGNEKITDFHQKITDCANRFQIKLRASQTGYVDQGRDFGSPEVKAIVAPKIALLSGERISSLNFGEAWYFIEQELDYPLSVLDLNQLQGADLSTYNVLIFPSGNYESLAAEGTQKLKEWISNGGKLIAIENSLDFFSKQKAFQLATSLNDAEKKEIEKRDSLLLMKEMLSPYLSKERLDISSGLSGAVFEVKMDETHPLGYGTFGKYYSLKNQAKHYSYLKKGTNAGIIPSMDFHRTGFVGAKAKEQLPNSLAFGVEEIGKGEIIYMADNPLFRNFWENGKLIFGNALFMVGQ